MRIDGSYGEGGGQILRTSIALSAILGEEVEIVNIRAKRRNPGLAAQHLWGIKLVAMLSSAHVEGLKLGSTRIIFKPSRIRGGEYRIDIGTAGSITLLLQAAIPVALFSEEPITIRIRGGTDVPWSPPADYYRHVLLPILSRMGGKIDMYILERGYYPEGGGEVVVKVEPSELHGLDLMSRGDFLGRRAYINLRNLPMHIARRMASRLQGFDVSMDVEGKSPSRGCGLLLLSDYSSTILSGSSLCRKGVPAESVAESALMELKREEDSDATVDVHMGDHLITFGFLAKGETRFRVREVSSHMKTNAWVVERFGGSVEIRGNEVRVQAYM